MIEGISPVHPISSREIPLRVPVISPLRKFLEQHRLRSGNPEAGIMFKTRNNTPVSMNNLLNDQILPALNACEPCGKLRAEHARADHEHQTDRSLPGWHAFRRGLATNLHALGVDDKTIQTIQAILRHSKVAVAQACYIKTLPQPSIAAMQKLEGLVDRSSLICNQGG